MAFKLFKSQGQVSLFLGLMKAVYNSCFNFQQIVTCMAFKLLLYITLSVKPESQGQVYLFLGLIEAVHPSCFTLDCICNGIQAFFLYINVHYLRPV
jgi:hypothetical protein